LALRKGEGRATSELTLRRPGAAPFDLAVSARMDGDTARLGIEGRGRLAPLAAWLGERVGSTIERDMVLLSLEATLGPDRRIEARGAAGVGDGIALEGDAVLADGTLRATLSRGAADLALLARLLGLGWEPSGRAEVADATVAWKLDAPGLPVVRAQVALPTLALSAAGRAIRVEGVQGRLALDPDAAGHALTGELRAERVEADGVGASPAAARYRARLGSGWAPGRVDLDGLRLRLDGVTFQGKAGYDVPTGRLDAELTAPGFEASALVGRLAPGWLGPGDRLGLSGLRLVATGLEPAGLDAGRLLIQAGSVAARRGQAEVAAGRVTARADLDPAGIALALEAESLALAAAELRTPVPRLVARGGLVRADDGGLRLGQLDLAIQDAQGREALTAGVRPGTRPGSLAVSARAPQLERLGWLWPAVRREVKGTARLDVEVSGDGFAEADGRVVLDVAESELPDLKVSIRELRADVPVHRGVAGEPPWGTLEVGELIGYGVVVRDVTTPVRVWKGRLLLNDLTYALYSGTGKGWSEVDLEPEGLRVRGEVSGAGVRIEEFMSAYGIRGGTMTGLLGYELDYDYRAGQLGVKGRFDVPEGGTVNIEILDRLLAYAEADPTGIVRGTLTNLRVFDYKRAEALVRSAGGGIRVSVTLRGRERLLVFPAPVPEINIRNLPLSFLSRQFPRN
jgi:hypothetical protein